MIRSIVLALCLILAPVAFAHDVLVSWTASAPVSGVTVAGYNIYRGTVTGGPYTKINTDLVTPGVTFDDTTVKGGAKYFYVITAVSTAQIESIFSSEAPATVPLNAPSGLGGKVTILIKPYGDINDSNKNSRQYESTGGGRQREPQPVV